MQKLKERGMCCGGRNKAMSDLSADFVKTGWSLIDKGDDVWNGFVAQEFAWGTWGDLSTGTAPIFLLRGFW